MSRLDGNRVLSVSGVFVPPQGAMVSSRQRGCGEQVSVVCGSLVAMSQDKVVTEGICEERRRPTRPRSFVRSGFFADGVGFHGSTIDSSPSWGIVQGREREPDRKGSQWGEKPCRSSTGLSQRVSRRCVPAVPPDGSFSVPLYR